MANGFHMNLQQPQVAYHYLLRLRWFSVAGQILTLVIAVGFFKLVLPLGFLAGGIGLTATTNLLAGLFRRKLLSHPTLISFALIFLDTVILTAMLYQTGGAHNPFSALYLLHITLGAILLPAWGPWLILGICGIGFWILFASPHELVSATGIIDWNTMSAHLRGMLLSMLIAGAGIAYFVSRLSASLARHHRELEKIRAEAVRQEHFASLATLSAGLAHELATPLSTIAVVSADMEGHGEMNGSEAYLEDVRLIRSEVDRCRAILDRVGSEILNMDSSQVDRVDLTSLEELLRPFLKKDYFRQIQFEEVAPSLSICVPETPLLQSLAVLLRNACEASEKDQPVRLKVEEQEDGIVFAVIDQGSGMDPEVVARLGEPFFTTKEPGYGMGLGLFVVRTFVDRMKGELEVDSVPGRGSTIRLRFPSRNKVLDG